MRIQQRIFALFFLSVFYLQPTKAVVNNGSKTENEVSASSTNDKNGTVIDDKVPEDSVAESTEQKSIRREAPHATYGPPLDVYVPSSPGNLGLPVYGVPPQDAYGPPPIIIQDVHPPVKFNPRPLKPFSFPKPVYGPPPHFNYPRPQYGPPKHLFNVHKPKPIIKIPKTHYGPPKPLYLPYKPQVYGPPKPVYGPPKIVYGPPTPIKYHVDPAPHAPPPGVPAPPTPPDIKYDGWQPIPGLVSRPPSGSYGSPQAQIVDSHQYNVDLIPPAQPDAYNKPHGISDSYNAPLNSVTGSGGVITTSGNDHENRVTDHNNGGVSVVKSVGYEIFATPGVGGTNSYTTAPISSHASIEGLSSSFDANLGAIGLVPPSGSYGTPSGIPILNVEPHVPTNLYSLPSKNPTSFQNFAQGPSFYNSGHLTSYTAPLGIVDGSYRLPHSSYDSSGFASSVSENYAAPYFSGGHDCSHKSAPVPQLSFGVPSANSYSASLASLNTNIAGAHQVTPDLQIAYSHATDSVSNSSDQVRYQPDPRAKELSENIAGDNELIRSQSIDINNIPLQGALGSYTLQIQSADGGNSNVPHTQVLNDGLLQSILNAIEQPQQNTATILSQPLLHLQQIPPQVPQQDFNFMGNINNQNIVVTPPPLQGEASSDFIDNNEIALYFNNNPDFIDDKNNRNPEQIGSYVMFTNGNSSFAYGDAKLQKENAETVELKA